jgi:protein SCO1
MRKLISALSFALAIACNQSPAPAPEAIAAAEPAPAATAPELPVADAPSIYELDMRLTDQDGKRRTLESLRGRPVILTMFYGTCPYACPMLISDIKRALANAEPAARSEFRVVLVSFDPKRDTSQALKDLADVHSVDLPEWRFTHADGGKERELAAVLGIKYKRLTNGHIQHTSVIAVLDENGKLRHRKEGTPEGSDEALVRALNSVAGKSAARLSLASEPAK